MIASNQAAMRTAIGLGSVNNTADTAKPVSTATQAAINAINDVNVFASLLDVTGVKSNDLVVITGDKAYIATGPASFVDLVATPTTHSHAASQISSGTVDPARLGSGTSITTKFLRGDSTWQSIPGGGDALVASSLDQFADVTQTSGATLAISASTTLNGGSHGGTNTGDQTITLTGMVTGSGTGTFAASLGTFTKAQLNTAVSDGNVLYVGDSALTVRDIDGTPSVAATTLEFTNGTVSDQGGGVVRVTIASGGLGEPLIMPSTAMAALAIDVTKFVNTKSISADSTMTFSNATPTAGTRTEVRVTTDSTARTLTIPSSWSYARNALITSILIPANSTLSLIFDYVSAPSSRWEVYGDPVETTGTGSYVLATSPTLVTPALGTPSAGVLTNCTGYPTASASEVTTGTDTAKIVTADALAGSILGIRSLIIPVFDYTTNVTVGDGGGYGFVPTSLNGMNLVSCHAYVITAGTTGTTDIQVARIRSGTPVDMLTTKMTIDSTETGTDTAATPAVINASNDDVATHDRIRIDVDAVSTTAPQGLFVVLNFQLP
jgi:hypothetical protein